MLTVNGQSYQSELLHVLARYLLINRQVDGGGTAHQRIVSSEDVRTGYSSGQVLLASQLLGARKTAEGEGGERVLGKKV